MRIAFVGSGGAMAYPMRQPVHVNVLDKLEMVTVRSRMPGQVAIGMMATGVGDVLVRIVGEDGEIVLDTDCGERSELLT